MAINTSYPNTPGGSNTTFGMGAVTELGRITFQCNDGDKYGEMCRVSADGQVTIDWGWVEAAARGPYPSRPNFTEGVATVWATANLLLAVKRGLWKEARCANIDINHLTLVEICDRIRQQKATANDWWFLKTFGRGEEHREMVKEACKRYVGLGHENPPSSSVNMWDE